MPIVNHVLQKRTIEILLHSQDVARMWMDREGVTMDDMTQDEYIAMLQDVMSMRDKPVQNIICSSKLSV